MPDTIESCASALAAITNLLSAYFTAEPLTPEACALSLGFGSIGISALTRVSDVLNDYPKFLEGVEQFAYTFGALFFIGIR